MPTAKPKDIDEAETFPLHPDYAKRYSNNFV